MAETLTVTLWPRLMRDIERLHRYDIYGQTVEEVARGLIMRQIQDLVSAKVLPLSYDAETKERAADPVETPMPVVVPAPEPPKMAPVEIPPPPTVESTPEPFVNPSVAALSAVLRTDEPKDTRHKTPERVALLREMWFRPGTPGNPSPSRVEILAAINALPGGQIPEKHLAPYVIQWGISKSARVRVPALRSGETVPPPNPVAPDITEETTEVLAVEPTPESFVFEVTAPEIEAEPEFIADAARRLGYPVEQPKGPTFADLAVRKEPYKPPPPVQRPNLGPPRLAKALTLPEATNLPMDPIDADAATIRATADLWGITFRGSVDLWAVNKAAEKRGARPFRLVETAQKSRQRHCMSCGKPFASEGPHNRLCSVCDNHSVSPYEAA